MRYTSRILAIASVLSLLAPSGALAATNRGAPTKAMKLSDVLAISQKNKKSASFELHMKTKGDGTTISFDLQGRQKGNPTAVNDLAGDMTFSLDATLTDGSTASADGQLIIVGGVAYVMLDSIDSTNAFLAIYADALREHVGTWFSIPLDEAEIAGDLSEQKKNDAAIRALNKFFDVKQEKTRDGTTYTATVAKAKQAGLFKKLMGGDRLSSIVPGQSEGTPTGTADMSVTLKTMRDAFQSLTMDATFLSKTGTRKNTTTMTFSSTVLDSAPAIAAPANSMPLDEAFGTTLGEDESASSSEAARDAQRKSDVNTILNAVYQYAIDHDGYLPASLERSGTARKPICKSLTPCTGVSLDVLLESYLVRIPSDPSQDAAKKESGYRIQVLDDGRITVSAPLAEGGTSISVTR